MADRTPTYLSDRFLLAFSFAAGLHREQTKKQGGAPYLAHLMDVCALVLQSGGTEDQAIAALLHDAAEDQGGSTTLATIRQMFGKTVAQIVLDCSDSMDGEDAPGWRKRKETQIEHFRKDALAESCLVYGADKLSNSRSHLLELESSGRAAFKNMRNPPEETIWYMRSMSKVFRQRGADPVFLNELDRTLDLLEQRIAKVK